ncbi:coiled-coil domain containing 53 [Anticarsia gemmatalis]|uniref:coiled-coil domain containing 53 n=1 Tax=Anticarsia gemmatalis TaxID=129554 RepID=UPI003F7674A3
MTLEETMLNQELENVDLSKITALQQKRTIAFINHFVLTNVQFLNNFMKKCEQKLMNFERKLEKVNAAMVLLEARLSSIPELNTPTPATEDIVDSKPAAEAQDTLPKEDAPTTDLPQVETTTESTEPTETKQARPEYDRFVKMVQVGVPLQAVKLKVGLEGLDPNVLDEILGK